MLGRFTREPELAGEDRLYPFNELLEGHVAVEDAAAPSIDAVVGDTPIVEQIHVEEDDVQVLLAGIHP